jgi:hypothetical protein
MSDLPSDLPARCRSRVECSHALGPFFWRAQAGRFSRAWKPRWMKLARAGCTFVGYVSANQTPWTPREVALGAPSRGSRRFLPSWPQGPPPPGCLFVRRRRLRGKRS